MEAPRTPLGPAELFTRTFALWWSNFGALTKTALIVAFPLSVVSFAIIALAFPSELFRVDLDPSADPYAMYENVDLVLLGLGYLLLVLIGALAMALLLGGVLQQLGDATVGRAPQTGSAFRLAWAKSGSFVVTYLLLVAAFIAISIPLLIPALWLGVGWITAYSLLIWIPLAWLAIGWIAAFPILAFEGTGGWAALSRSFELVRGRWWATFGAVLLVSLVLGVAAIVLYIPYVVVLFTGGGAMTAMAASAVIGFVVTVLFYPALASLIASVYFDLRLRKRGVVPTPEGETGFGWEQIYAVPERT
ncbi:MAG: hypothetical protein H0U42_10855 [Thermoleophilaceae bacterium]|nr:hypothetical protein [Thermoleophilaceae bacterium]